MNICVSITDETTEGVVERMQALEGVADLFEIRADLVLDLDLLTILRAKTRPLVLTCRPESEGGRWPDDDHNRRLALLEGVKRGYDYVDIEHRSGLLDVMMEKAGRGLIVSHHDFQSMPADLDGLYAAMRDQGADIVKIAVTPRSIADVGRLLDLARRVGAGGGPPLVPIALGAAGMASRILSGRYGAPFTYASTSAGAESAPGQVPAAIMANLYRAGSISAATRAYGVLGSDVGRSLSPILHNRAFEARGIDAVYVPLQAARLDAFLEALPALALSGFSVTRPYKVEIVPFLHEIEERAAVCGSVNTVTVQPDGTLRGSTTDGLGLLASLKKRVDVKGRAVVILGAGGAARSAALSLANKGASVTLLARDPASAAAAAKLVGCGAGPLTEAGRRPWDVLVNATPVGSGALAAESPLPARLHRPGSVVLDMVYDPLETRLLREARAAGCTIIDGLEMLVAQAVAQFETWTGVEAPVDVMRKAALFIAQAQAQAR
jgi:3-dehydroquinate dehydratase/shikimate dehydrogenase